MGTRRDLGGLAMHRDKMIVCAQILQTQKKYSSGASMMYAGLTALAQVRHDCRDWWASGIHLQATILSEKA